MKPTLKLVLAALLASTANLSLACTEDGKDGIFPKTNIIQNAMRTDKPPRLHGLVYDIADGVLKDLQVDGEGVMRNMEHIYATEAHEQDEDSEAPAEPDQDASGYAGPQLNPAGLPAHSLAE